MAGNVGNTDFTGIEIAIRERLVKLETKQEDLQESLNEIKTNHLPHIQMSIEKLDTKLDSKVDTLKMWLLGLLGTTVLALTTNLIIVIVNRL